MIEKFVSLNAIAVPLNRGNVDTDAIIPARFLKTVKRTGLGDNLFHAWRYDEGGREVPDFPLNKPPYRGGKILVTGENFGCGSSREHAVWARTEPCARSISRCFPRSACWRGWTRSPSLSSTSRTSPSTSAKGRGRVPGSSWIFDRRKILPPSGGAVPPNARNGMVNSPVSE